MLVFSVNAPRTFSKLSLGLVLYFFKSIFFTFNCSDIECCNRIVT